MTASMTSLLPSVKCTVSPSKWETFGLTVRPPWPRRGSRDSETVGWELNSLWPGFGNPKSVTLPTVMRSRAAMTQRCVSRGIIRVMKGLIISSPGLPNMNLGKT